MKIAYILLKGMPLGGGIEKYTEEVGSRLAAMGHEVVVYTMRHYGARDGIYKGMKIKTVPSIRNRVLEKLSGSFTATLLQCLERDVDIVHFHNSGPALFCFMPKIMGRKTVAQGHGLEWKRSRWGRGGRMFLKLIERSLAGLPDILTVVSRQQQEYFRGSYNRDSVYIPTGVNPAVSEPPDIIRRYGVTGDDYILFAGRLVNEKGAHYLIEAYKQVGTDLKLIIAGDAPYEEGYKSRLRRMAGGSSSIIFTGFVSGKTLDELYSNCRIFVLPSEVEGLSTALLEAMSYGNCCLASDIPENREALSGFGFLFRSRDPVDLALKLQGLIGDRALAGSVGQRARRHVMENNLWDNIAKDFERLYLGLNA